MSIVSITAIFANEEEAARIGEAMVEARLAACVNIVGPVHSIFRWKGKVERADEVVAVFKTTALAADALITRVAGLHSDEVPCIFSEPIDKVLASYAEWVESNVGG